MFGSARLWIAAGLSLALAAGLIAPALAGEASAARGGKFGLGRAATPGEIAGWDIDVRPDGQGLPPGQGTAVEGEELYAELCAACHGEFGEAFGRYPVLIGGEDSLDTDQPVKSVGSYWPYASTVFDYVRRAMPFGGGQTLSPDQTYAIVAFLLYSNDLIEEDFVLDQSTLAQVEMPNAQGFFVFEGEEFPLAEPCVENCEVPTEVVGRARIIDVTPDEEEAPAPMD